MVRVTEITVYAEAGEQISHAIDAAIQLAGERECRVRLIFNDVPMEISGSSTAEEIGNGWSEIKRRQAELVGATVMSSGQVRWGRTD